MVGCPYLARSRGVLAVILSATKDLAHRTERPFAVLRVTASLLSTCLIGVFNIRRWVVEFQKAVMWRGSRRQSAGSIHYEYFVMKEIDEEP